MDEDLFTCSFREVHSREEEYSGGPAESPQPGPSHRMVSSSQGVQHNQ